jgi:hypothetical protein
MSAFAGTGATGGKGTGAGVGSGAGPPTVNTSIPLICGSPLVPLTNSIVTLPSLINGNTVTM